MPADPKGCPSTPAAGGEEPAEGRTAVTVVHTAACHFCDDARATLGEFARQFPLRIELVDAHSPSARWLMRTHRASMYPLVLVDGAFFSHGRLPRAKLRALLERRAAVPSR
jgi:glutaredoxin